MKALSSSSIHPFLSMKENQTYLDNLFKGIGKMSYLKKEAQLKSKFSYESSTFKDIVRSGFIFPYIKIISKEIIAPKSNENLKPFSKDLQPINETPIESGKKQEEMNLSETPKENFLENNSKLFEIYYHFPQIEPSREKEFGQWIKGFGQVESKIEEWLGEYSLFRSKIQVIEMRKFVYNLFVETCPKCNSYINSCLENLKKYLYEKLKDNYIILESENYKQLQEIKSIFLKNYVEYSDKILKFRSPDFILEPFIHDIQLILDKLQFPPEEEKKSLDLNNSNVQRQNENPNESNQCDWRIDGEKLLEMLNRKEFEILNPRFYSDSPIERDNMLSRLLKIIQTCRRNFPTRETHETFKKINENFISLLPISLAKKEQELQSCREILSPDSNQRIRKQILHNNLVEYQIIESGLNENQKIFTLFSTFYGLNMSNPETGIEQDPPKAFSHYSPLVREICRKLIAYFSKFSVENKRIYTYKKLDEFDHNLQKYLDKNNIDKNYESPLTKAFIGVDLYSPLDLKKMFIEILKTYSNDETFLGYIEKLKAFPNLKMNGDFLNLINKIGKILIEPLNGEISSRHILFVVPGLFSNENNSTEAWANILRLFPFTKIFNIRFSCTTKFQFGLSIFGMLVFSPITIPLQLLRNSNENPSENHSRLQKKEEFSFLGFYSRALNPIHLLYDKIKSIHYLGAFPRAFEFLEYYVNPLKQYHEAWNQAGYSAALIALSIALKAPSEFESISLLGYSLGTKLICNLIFYLKELGVYDRIHDVILMGGAAKIDQSLPEVRESFEIVNGKVFNCYSDNDSTLNRYASNVTPYYADSIGIKELISRLNVEPNNQPYYYWPGTVYERGKNVRNILNHLDHDAYYSNMEELIKKMYEKFNYPQFL